MTVPGDKQMEGGWLKVHCGGTTSAASAASPLDDLEAESHTWLTRSRNALGGFRHA